MEVTSADARKLLGMGSGSDAPVITVWDARKLQQVKRSPASNIVAGVIDTLGKRSGVAQALPKAITSAALMAGSPHTLFVLSQNGLAIGILKIGEKNLFIRRVTGALVEMTPVCVLDFYVAETHQRTGLGKLLFEHMLDHIQTPPHRLAYDRPSPKLVSFLKKHYSLVDYLAQNNNYVVFNKYFTEGTQYVPAARPRETGADAPTTPATPDDDAASTHCPVEGLGRAATVHSVSGTPLTAAPKSSLGTPCATGSGRFASPQKRTSYNIITQQGFGGEVETPVVRTGKRLVRPL